MRLFLIALAWAEPTVDIDVERTVGLLDKTHLEKAFRLRQDPLLACYADHLDDTPTAEGTVVLDITLQRDPTAADVVRSELPELDRCLQDAILDQRWGLCTGKGHRMAVVRLNLRFQPDKR